MESRGKRHHTMQHTAREITRTPKRHYTETADTRNRYETTNTLHQTAQQCHRDTVTIQRASLLLHVVKTETVW